MSIIQAIFLGLVQGFTEFIPISSSGHLILARHFMDLPTTGLTFDVALNIGTLAALVIYFHKDIWLLAKAIFGKQKETKLAWLLVAATVPAVIAGVLLEKSAETAFRSPRLVAINLFIVAIIMLFAERHYHRKVKKPTKIDNVSKKQAIGMGIAQAAALIPGVSRSGSTISVGLFLGMDRVDAMRFSFLLGIPIMFGGIAKKLLEPGFTGQFQHEQAQYIAGILAAFLSGVIAIRFLLAYLSKHSLSIFAYYRIGLSAIVLIVLALTA
ncbi:MAG: undecaprenyl-diphosphatase UppP [Candidatus Saccharimonadales bacterium]